MKKHCLAIFAITAGVSALAQQDRVPSGLRPLSSKEPGKANEVTVVLDPPTADVEKEERPRAALPPLIENADSLPAPEKDQEPSIRPPVLVGKKQDVIVRVEKLQTPTGPVDPGDVQLLAPFPAKLPGAVPKGWKLDSSGSAPPFTREVEISPGSKITLNIRPHVLIPDADGSTTFSVQEPGYESSLGYQQKETVSAILSKSIQQLEDDSKQMGDAIDQLQQLLVSLPKSEDAENVQSPPAAKPVQKR